MRRRCTSSTPFPTQLQESPPRQPYPRSSHPCQPRWSRFLVDPCPPSLSPCKPWYEGRGLDHQDNISETYSTLATLLLIGGKSPLSSFRRFKKSSHCQLVKQASNQTPHFRWKDKLLQMTMVRSLVSTIGPKTGSGVHSGWQVVDGEATKSLRRSA